MKSTFIFPLFNSSSEYTFIKPEPEEEEEDTDVDVVLVVIGDDDDDQHHLLLLLLIPCQQSVHLHKPAPRSPFQFHSQVSPLL